jgi:isopenicillin-N N-acyltransferase-like protein
MIHEKIFSFSAEDHRTLGRTMGSCFSSAARAALKYASSLSEWQWRTKEAPHYLPYAERYFPQFVDELRGYAEGAGIDFTLFWALAIEEDRAHADKCTTIVTNNGRLIGHNEDFDSEIGRDLCIIRKTVGDTGTLELFYPYAPGGNAIAINSSGYIIAVNSLTHSGKKGAGVPRNIIARWLSETKDPRKDFAFLSSLPRSSGYSHTFLGADSALHNIEYTATEARLTKPSMPYIHTNHYLTDLSKYEANTGSSSTHERFADATAAVREHMTTQELKVLMDRTAGGSEKGIMNNDTLGKMIIDRDSLTAHIWLRSEKEKGFIEYPLNSLPTKTAL